MRHQQLHRILLPAAVLAAAVLLLAACENGLDIVETVKTEVMVANDKFLEVLSANLNTGTTLLNQVPTNVNPGETITIMFDRELDESTISAATIQVNPPNGLEPYTLDFTYNAANRTLLVSADPYLADNEDYTVQLTTALKAKDGSRLQQTRTLSFTTGVYPKGNVAIEADAAYSTDTSVNLNLIYTGDVQRYRMSWVSENDLLTNSANTWESISGTVSSTMPPGDGPKTLWIQFQNNAVPAVVSAVRTETIVLDSTPPSISAFSINGGATYATAASCLASLAQTATDATSGVSQMQFSNDGSSWSTLETYAASKSGWSLGSTQGSRTVRIRVTDLAGNIGTATDTIIQDTTAPAVGPFSINAGATYTTATTYLVALAQTATDATSGVSQMQFSNDGSSWSTLETYAASKSGWSLGSTQGSRTVRIRVTDLAGNIGTATDTIIQDTVNPTLSYFRIGDSPNPTYTNDPTPNLYLSATDASSGMYQMMFSNDASTWTTVSYADWYIDWAMVGSDGTCYIYVKVSDQAGNTTPATCYTTIRDTVAPRMDLVRINGGVSSTNDPNVSLALTASDGPGPVRSGLYQVHYSSDGIGWTDWESNTADTFTGAFYLPDSAGTHSVCAQVMDAAGNTSEVEPDAWDSIVLNARIVITYLVMEIEDDGDVDGTLPDPGELYWTFTINGDTTLYRPESSALSVTAPYVLSGTELGTTYSFTIYRHPSSGSFNMAGRVYDDDGTTDPYGTMALVSYSAPFADTGGTRVIGGTVDGTISYSIDMQN